MKNILLLDAYNLIYRARYSGMNKGNNSTVFNFFRGIRPLVEKFNPDITYFVLEGRPKKRLEVSPDYKGQRVYTDKDDFNRQRKEIISLVKEYLPFVVVKHDDFECDDIINHLAVNNHKNDNVTIVSSDTDFIQSIKENIKLYNPVQKKFLEATTYDYVSWKSLVGDKSDNIEGFKGIGNKKAQKLLSDNNALEDFLIKENNRDIYNRNTFMIKFHELNNSEITSIQLHSLSNKPDWNNLKQIFIDYEFNSITKKDKTWNNFINTFDNLERNMKYDN
mgnify:FL=1|tara:strand:- start:524 stop:1354 length:831 start_codon:yes stop_codon:yes gene_type:complete